MEAFLYPRTPIFRVIKMTKETPVDSSLQRVSWTKESEFELGRLVSLHNGKNWKVISLGLNKRLKGKNFSSKQCRERWTNCINPDVKRTTLTEQEELALLMYHHAYPNKWAQIAKMIPNRSGNALKNNFDSLIKKIIRRITVKEDCNNEACPLFFLQSLYASLIISNFLKPESIQNNTFPNHIMTHIKDKSLTIEKCEDYKSG